MGLQRLTPTQRDASRGLLARMRREDLAARLARWTREALADGRIVTPLNREALYRRIIRSTLCLQGWRWNAADASAMAVVQISLELVQARRPPWNEGQPEYVIAAGTLIERTRCANCHGKLPEGRPKFCSAHCRNAYNLRLMRRRQADDERVITLAGMGAI